MDTIAACPTYFKGIKMRSRNEAHYAAWISRWWRWRYEWVTFADGISQWRIDFMLDNVTTTWTADPVTVFVEVKPGRWFEEVPDVKRRSLLARMSAVFATDPNAVCIIEQSGAHGSPLIVRFGPGDALPVAHEGRWLYAGDGPPVLGMVADMTEWGGRAA